MTALPSWLDDYFGVIVRSLGVEYPQRPVVELVGVGVTIDVADDAVNERVVVTLTAAGGGGSISVVPRRSSAVTTTLVSTTDYHLSMTVTGQIAKLPSAPSDGETFVVKAAFSTVDGTVIVEPLGGEATIEGAATFELGPRESATLRYNADTVDWEDC